MALSSPPAEEDLLPEALQIREKLKAGYPRDPFNVLFLGQTGAGKSSLINSLITAVDKLGYREHAIKGVGGTRTGGAAVTTGLTFVKMFADEMDYTIAPQWFPGPSYIICKIIAVFRDITREGGVPNRTALGELSRLKRRTHSGPMGLNRYLFGTDNVDQLADSDSRPHLIVYVQSANFHPAESFLASITGLVRSTEDNTLETTTMLVITHADKITVSDTELAAEKTNNSSRGSDEEIKRILKKKKLEDIAQFTAQNLKMKDAWERIFILSSYSVETAGDEDKDIHRNHEIDKNMCGLWKKMLQRQYYGQFEKNTPQQSEKSTLSNALDAGRKCKIL